MDPILPLGPFVLTLTNSLSLWKLRIRSCSLLKMLNIITICFQEKMARLAVLLSLQQPPTRQSLLRDASRFGVVQAAVPHVQDMYNFLEVEFHPLKLCSKMEASMKLVEENEGLSLVSRRNTI